MVADSLHMRQYDLRAAAGLPVLQTSMLATLTWRSPAALLP